MNIKTNNYKFYKKVSSDKKTEIAYISNPDLWETFEILLVEFQNGSRCNVQSLDNDMLGGREKYMEITKQFSPTWETMAATEVDIENLIECCNCVDTQSCLGCGKRLIYH